MFYIYKIFFLILGSILHNPLKIIFCAKHNGLILFYLISCIVLHNFCKNYEEGISTIMNVFILTFCRNLEAFYGTSLIFKTLRVGFPNARVYVVDNASLPEAQAQIATLCRENECEFKRMTGSGLQHHEFIDTTIREQATVSSSDGPLVFLDPDICLWQSCENFSFGGLIAGKKLSKFYDSITNTVTMPRIHSSFLWVKDARALLHEILRIKAKRFDFLPFQSFSFNMDGSWFRYDTGANLYAALPEKHSFFSDSHFEYYDHLYAGSHLDWIFHLYDDECREMMTRTHNYAKTNNIIPLKGIWREQDKIFKKSFAAVPDSTERMVSNEEKNRSIPGKIGLRDTQGVGIL
jgi:hypothetical protein